MENFEINILKRNGDWKKYNQKDISLSSAKNTDREELSDGVKNDKNNDVNFISFINEVNLIINKLEDLENEKNNLKNELKKYEKIFQTEKNLFLSNHLSEFEMTVFQTVEKLICKKVEV
jgi:seryl-tRNA synthetase